MSVSSMKQGVKDYLLKPVAPDELVEALRKIRKEVREEERRKQIEIGPDASACSTPNYKKIQEQYLLHLVKEEWLQLNLL